MYERIVVGTDGSQGALDAVRAAAHLARLGGAQEIHVVNACRTYSSYEMARIRESLPPEFHDYVDPMLDAQDRFDEARAVIGPDLEMVSHALAGDAGAAILGVAEDIDADLIVVGARGLNAVQRFVRGSVSTRVAHHSPCDVLIVEHDE